MTRFAIIDPTTKTIKPLESDDLEQAYKAVGLTSGAVGFGTVGGKSPFCMFGIVVYEFGLVRPLTEKYFSIDHMLFNGPAVVYSFNPATGDTIDNPEEFCEHMAEHHIHWFDGKDAVEKAIKEEKIQRPQTTVNGVVMWSWNETPIHLH